MKHSALAGLVLALACLAGPAARAQHPLPPKQRPLHERIAAADVVAVATIGPIHEGRIEVRDATVLRGDAPASFEIKRSPAAPPPFVTGVPAVLLLRGARPPYVLVDEPREVVIPSDAAAAKRWTDALRSLFAAGSDPQKLVHTYLIWLDGDDDALRDAAGAALSVSNVPYLPLDREDALDRARAALDPGRVPSARRVSAGLAASQSDGAAALVAGIPGESPDPQVVAVALRGTPSVGREAREAALLRSLAHREAGVRRAALLAAPDLWNEAVAAKVKQLAAEDPDVDVKEDAQDAVARAGQETN
jgi:hypothetical protein